MQAAQARGHDVDLVRAVDLQRLLGATAKRPTASRVTAGGAPAAGSSTSSAWPPSTTPKSSTSGVPEYQQRGPIRLLPCQSPSAR